MNAWKLFWHRFFGVHVWQQFDTWNIVSNNGNQTKAVEYHLYCKACGNITKRVL